MVNLQNVVRDIRLFVEEVKDIQKEADKKAYRLEKQLNSSTGTFKATRETVNALQAQVTALQVRAEQLQSLVAVVEDELKGMRD